MVNEQQPAATEKVQNGESFTLFANKKLPLKAFALPYQQVSKRMYKLILAYFIAERK